MSSHDHSIMEMLKEAFKKTFQGISLDREGKNFIAISVVQGLQWNCDHDPSDHGFPRSSVGQNRAKFAVNIQKKEILHAILSGTGKLSGELYDSFVELPDSVHCRIYKHSSPFCKKPIFEHCARQMTESEITKALTIIEDLLSVQTPSGYRGFPIPHLHVFKEIWHEGETDDPDLLLSRMKEAKRILQPVMTVLERRVV